MKLRAQQALRRGLGQAPSNANRKRSYTSALHLSPLEPVSNQRGPPVVFSGIQPTGIPHLGNYLGALRPWKDSQDSSVAHPDHDPSKLYFCVVDLHALTGFHGARLLTKHRKETYAALLAIGLSSKHSSIFLQNEIQEHASMMWILSTIASTGYLSRMTQWKSKLALPDDAKITDSAAIENLRLGLFSYPVLQAADILLYKPDIVPVGEDQAQHVEFARDMARRFNHAFCPANEPFFDMPMPQISPAKRIMSLQDPSRKMSKSDSNLNSRILITDTEEEIHGKIKRAVTDSQSGITYDPETRPGVSNLLDILRHTKKWSDLSPEEVARDMKTMSKAALKNATAQAVTAELKPIGEKFAMLMNTKAGQDELRETMFNGRHRARKRATHHMQQVRELVGIDRIFEKAS